MARPLLPGVDPPPGSTAHMRKEEKQRLHFVHMMQAVKEEVESAAWHLDHMPDCPGIQPESRRWAFRIRTIVARVMNALDGFKDVE